MTLPLISTKTKTKGEIKMNSTEHWIINIIIIKQQYNRSNEPRMEINSNTKCRRIHNNQTLKRKSIQTKTTIK